MAVNDTQVLEMDDTSSEVLARVQQYINRNVYNSAVWDALPEQLQVKAIYNAYRTLITLLPDIFNGSSETTIDLDDLVAEIMWLIKKDDSTDRAEQGATGITLGDMSIYFDKDKSGLLIAPAIVTRYDLALNGQRRRVGRYEVPREDTTRTGIYQGNRRFNYL